MVNKFNNIIAFPKIEKNERLEDFLLRNRNKNLPQIDLTIKSGQPELDFETIYLIPYFITYDSKNNEHRTIERRIGNNFASIAYSNMEEKMIEGIIKSSIKAEDKIMLHGKKCARYCAQFGFNSRLFMEDTLDNNRLKLIYKTSFEEVSKEEPIIFIPSLIYI